MNRRWSSRASFPLQGICPIHTFSNGTLRLSWRGDLGVTYRLEFTNDLDSPVWRAVGAAESGIGQIISVAVPLEDRAIRFYRVVGE